MNETLNVIKRRCSVRSFLEKQVPDEALQAILEAGSCAPYAQEYTRHFTVVQNKALIDRLSEEAKAAAVLMDVPHLAALGQKKEYHCLYQAPTVILISAKEKSVAPESDCAAAIENMLIAAQSLEIESCWIYFTILAFLSPTGAALREVFKIPDGYNPSASVALGYAKEAAKSSLCESSSGVTYIY